MPLVLYEHSTSVCVNKVRLTLAEKGLDYEGRFVDLIRGGQFDPEYLRIHPGAVVPALVHDGRVILESSVIQYHLDDAFPEPALMPRDLFARTRVRWFMKTIDAPVHPACGALTHAISFRKNFPDRASIDARMAQIPDPRRRAQQRSVYEEGMASPYVIDAARDYAALLAAMNDALGDGPFLGGAAYSLADAAATPYVDRLDRLGILEAFAETRAPRVLDWFDRIRARPSFETGLACHLTAETAARLEPMADSDAAARVRAILAG